MAYSSRSAHSSPSVRYCMCLSLLGGSDALILERDEALGIGLVLDQGEVALRKTGGEERESGRPFPSKTGTIPRNSPSTRSAFRKSRASSPPPISHMSFPGFLRICAT